MMWDSVDNPAEDLISSSGASDLQPPSLRANGAKERFSE
jgi:hypothetical protein